MHFARKSLCIQTKCFWLSTVLSCQTLLTTKWKFKNKFQKHFNKLSNLKSFTSQFFLQLETLIFQPGETVGHTFCGKLRETLVAFCSLERNFMKHDSGTFLRLPIPSQLWGLTSNLCEDLLCLFFKTTSCEKIEKYCDNNDDYPSICWANSEKNEIIFNWGDKAVNVFFSFCSF